MNLCFLIGKIVSGVEFDFILRGKNISIARFEIVLDNKSIINVKGYDEIADFCYKNLAIGSVIGILGNLNSNMEIIIQEVEL